MLDVETAQQAILDAVASLPGSETISLADCARRVLAEDVVSPLDVPPAANSAMDGVALRCADVAEVPTTLLISQRVPAGLAPPPLQANSVARIFTGAEIPAGADAVVMQENCSITDTHVTVNTMPSPGENIRPRGQDIVAGAVILKGGRRLQAQDIGLLASIGKAEVRVKPRLKVAVISTGDELAAPGAVLAPGQIYNSNQAMLSSLLHTLDCEVLSCAVAGDTLAATEQSLRQAAAMADILITTGGVSVGEEDHVKAAVEALGVLDIWKVKIKPGKPLAFGRVLSSVFLGLPGNPVSAFVTFALFGVPLIKKLQGQQYAKPLSFFLPVNFDLIKAQTRPEYMRVRIHNRKLEKFANQSSGVLTSASWANALALIPANTALRRGDLVEVFPLDLLLGPN